MKKRLILSSILMLSTLSLFSKSLAYAKETYFQTVFSKDCSIYESIYEGLECRNASIGDVPVCDDNEDIVNSPRRSKLCCCTRLQNGEDDDEDIVNNNGDKSEACHTLDCRRANLKKDGDDILESTCSKGEILVRIDDPKSGCCCPEKVETKGLSACRLLACADPLTLDVHPQATFGTCPTGLVFSQINVSIELDKFSTNPGALLSSITHNCCCPTAGGELRLFCKEASPNCTPPIPGNAPGLGTCPSGQQSASLKIDNQSDTLSEPLLNRGCCCSP